MLPFIFMLHFRGPSPVFSITGDYRSGALLSVVSPMMQELVNLYRNLTIDLTGVIYMDSESMNLIRDLEPRCKIKWFENSHVHQRYLEKFQ